MTVACGSQQQRNDVVIFNFSRFFSPFLYGVCVFSESAWKWCRVPHLNYG